MWLHWVPVECPLHPEYEHKVLGKPEWPQAVARCGVAILGAQKLFLLKSYSGFCGWIWYSAVDLRASQPLFLPPCPSSCCRCSTCLDVSNLGASSWGVAVKISLRHTVLEDVLLRAWTRLALLVLLQECKRVILGHLVHPGQPGDHLCS